MLTTSSEVSTQTTFNAVNQERLRSATCRYVTARYLDNNIYDIRVIVSS